MGLRLARSEIGFGLAFRAFAPGILPIAAGYHVAHYLTSFLVDGQHLLSVLSHGLGLGERAVTTGLFIQSLNELIDVYGERNAALRKHVPEVVLFLLFAVFIIAGAVLGFSGGLEGGRPLLATIAMSVLIVLVIFIIIDLDRPRRGLIEVNQDSMLDLGAAIVPAALPQPAAGAP